MVQTFWSDLFLGQLQLAMTVFAVAFVIERLHPATRKQPWRGILFNVVVAFVFIYLTTLLVPPISAYVDPWRQHWGHLIPIRFGDGLGGSILQTLTFFLIFDFWFYWWHRAQHSVRWLWVQHKFHHQERWINVTTVHRYHFTEEIFRVFVIYLPMSILFDFKPVTVVWVWTAFTFWGYWIHMNVRVGLGPVGRWISGPQFHRLHHTPADMNSNFAAFFPIWDRIFGTYRHPERNEFPARTGVKGATDGNTIWEALVLPFVAWGALAQRVVAKAWKRRSEPDTNRV